MLPWFSSPAFQDPRLGLLRRAGGRWRGSVEIEPGLVVPFAVAGPRGAPDPEALASARDVPERFAAWRPVIARALLEHYRPYAEAVAAGELPPEDTSLPTLAHPEDVWPHVALQSVAVHPVAGVLTTELAYTTAWDEEHTLGARFQGGRFVELCGSLGPDSR